MDEDDLDGSMKQHGIRQLHDKKSGSCCSIHEVGATLLSFHPSPDQFSEVLFVSREAILDGSKAIRGGVPLVFPIFGPPSVDNQYETSDMPQHGFARTNVWKVDEDASTESTLVYTLTVKSDDTDLKSRGTTGLWAPSSASPSCLLQYIITLEATSLTTKLIMTNTSSGTATHFPVQALFHTYYQVHGQAALDGTKCFVKGLADYQLVDKVDPDNQTVEEIITIVKETDRVYHPPSDKNTVDVQIGVGLEDNAIIHMTCSGTVNNEPVPVSCVVWNPYVEKAQAMSDFGDDQYREMICVEPGILSGHHVLQPHQTAVLEQVISVQKL